jgi:hypothetical protein
MGKINNNFDKVYRMEQMSLDTGDIFIELYEQNTYIY